jgi:hypothetical protein
MAESALWVQADDANPLQRALANRVANYQIVEDEAGPDRLENLVELSPILRVRATAQCGADGGDRTSVNITDARIELFGARSAPHRCNTL